MSRSVPVAFYNSPAWKSCRAEYLRQHPLCEQCLEEGKYTPADHVHHIIWLTLDNYENPEISLNFNNLKSVCIPCHNRQKPDGSVSPAKRYEVDSYGRIVIK